MITELARQALRDFVQDNFLGYKIGTGGDSSNPNATNLDAPLSVGGAELQTSGITITTSGISSIDFTITLSASSYVGEVIREVGIFNTATDITIDGTTYAAGEIMLVRVPFDGIGPITSSDNIELVVSVDVV
jgi:hypothetical protein|tara:strand:+ start:180 stop:575 length:396 start_codon:yes stop_codon:yes gene_type:complete